MWEAYEVLQSFTIENWNLDEQQVDKELDEKVNRLLAEFDDFMNDDFNTAKVLANMFELVPVINSIKDKHQPADVLNKETLLLLQHKMKIFTEDVLGLKSELSGDHTKLDGVLQVLIDLRKQAKAKKDYVTSDAIRNQLLGLGITLKDEKNGSMSYTYN